MTIDIGIGTLYCKRDYKDSTKVFYIFKPSKEFDEKVLDIISNTENMKEQIERKLNEKLSEVYRYE